MFNKKRERKIDNLNLNFEEYEHECGMKHYHLRTSNQENCFVLAFPTLPTTDDGRAHILEHLVLCGSEKYPVRDPFFSMTRRSLATFMNALTYSDKTVYPFSTTDRQDFFNLMSVYVDATFFPKLDYLNFLQEGWRYEFKDEELKYQGIVYNEMNGAFGNKFHHVYKAIQRDLKPNTIYANESGGDPLCIPSLTYEEVIQFHKTHYHPSRATLMTFGDIDPKEIQDFIENEVISKIKSKYDRVVPQKSNLLKGVYNYNHFFPSSEELKDSENMLTCNWLIGELDSQMVADYQVLSNMLLEDGGKIHSALDNAGFGRPGQMLGLMDSNLECSLHISMEGLNKNEVEKASKLIFNELEKVAKDGIERNIIESTMDELELNMRKGGSRGVPFGLDLLLSGLHLATNEKDPLHFFDAETSLKKVRERFKNEEHVKELINGLLNNVPCVISSFEPDISFFDKRKNIESVRLKEKEKNLSEKEKEKIINDTKALLEWQSRKEDANCLPNINIDRLNREAKGSIPINFTEKENSPTIGFLDIPTNGVSYINMVFDLNSADKEDWKWLELISCLLPFMPTQKYGWEKAMEARNLMCQNVDIALDVISDIDNVNKGNIFFEITAYHLNRSNENIKNLIWMMLKDVSFSDFVRIKSLIENEIANFYQDLSSEGNYLALTELKSSLNFQGIFEKEITGINYVKFLKVVLKMIKTKNGKEEFKNKIKESMNRILTSEVVVFGAGNKEVKNLLESMQKDWTGIFSGLKSAKLKSNSFEHVERNIAKQAISADSNVNYCYSGYSALNFNNTNSVYLDLAAHLMTNNRMHTTLREQGGAYGAGASYNSFSGVFLLSTYRDPGFESTYKEFDAILEWFMKYDFTEEQLNEAKIGVLKNVDKPSIPQVESEKNISLHMMGISSELRNERKNKLIDASIKDVKNAVTNYLLGTSPNSCAFISKHSTNEANKLMFHLSEVKEIT